MIRSAGILDECGVLDDVGDQSLAFAIRRCKPRTIALDNRILQIERSLAQYAGRLHGNRR